MLTFHVQLKKEITARREMSALEEQSYQQFDLHGGQGPCRHHRCRRLHRPTP